MKIFVLGDIHGAYRALMQCFERSAFNYKKDRLIVLGDVCDGYTEVKQCIDELLKVQHCDYIIGNHDLWALDWATRGIKEDVWLRQGGRETIASYAGKAMPQAHIGFLKNAHLWVKFDRKLFVHAGFDPKKPMINHDLQTLVWDRDLLNDAWKKYLRNEDCQYADFEEIYLGHTTTELYNSLKPLKLCNVWALDTGAGWSGKLTIMDVATKKYWQSDLTPQLYGRK